MTFSVMDAISDYVETRMNIEHAIKDNRTHTKILRSDINKKYDFECHTLQSK